METAQKNTTYLCLGGMSADVIHITISFHEVGQARRKTNVDIVARSLAILKTEVTVHRDSLPVQVALMR